MTMQERTLIIALEAALRWSYLDTSKHAFAEKMPEGKFSNEYLSDLGQIRSGIRAAKILGVDLRHQKNGKAA